MKVVEFLKVCTKITFNKTSGWESYIIIVLSDKLLEVKRRTPTETQLKVIHM